MIRVWYVQCIRVTKQFLLLKKEEKMKKFLAAFMGLALLLISTAALAAPISGNIDFLGYASYTGGTTPSNATGIHFLGALTTSISNTGDYAGITASVNFQDFTFAPSLQPDPVTLWSFTSSGKTYNFTMDTVTSSVSPDGSSLTLVGTGLLGITGFDSTEGTWIFTTQGSNSILSFSAVADAAPVPEPGTISLLGAGLVGLGLYGRRKAKSKA